MQFSLFVPESDWKPPCVSTLPAWGQAKRVAIDVETNDATLKTLGPGVRRGAYIAGYSFAIEDGPKFYIPLRHIGGDNVRDAVQALGYLKEQAASFTGELVGANLGYDMDFLWSAGIKFPQIKKYRDVQIAEALIDELQMSYSLESICTKWLGVGKDENLLRAAAQAYKIDAKKDLHLLPARYVGPYAEADAALPLRALRRQEKEIDTQELWPIYNMESDLLPVLIRMRQRGVRVDVDKLTKVEQWAKDEEKKSLAIIHNLTGYQVPFNSVWQASALVPALQAIGVQIPLTPKTKKPSIDKAFLASIQHPVAQALARARRVNKIRTTFCQSIRDHIVGDRIHCTYNQLRSSTEEDEDGEGVGARYGRGSSQNPNMQQQPARDPEIGPLWRSIYIAEPEEHWFSADFSSQEPRQAVHYANTARLGNFRVRTPNGPVWVNADASAVSMAVKYRTDLATDPHQALADLLMGRKATKEERSFAKIIFLGLSYGMGGAKLCKQLGLPTIMAVRDYNAGLLDATSPQGKQLAAKGQKIFEAAGLQGQELLDKFDASVPFVRALNKICERAATSYGYICTQAGRKCRFPKDSEGNIMWAHKALNRLIQGSAADQTKMSLIALDKENIFITVQVHDEVCGSIKDKKEAEKIKEIMEKAYILCVPNKIDCEIGASWGDAS